MYRNRSVLFIFLILFAFFAITLEYNDRYISGDEVVTYSMANNVNGGFTFSNGRVGKYFDEHIRASSPAATINNMISTVLDVIKNRGNSAFFRSAVPDETGWYTADEIRDIYSVSREERFNYINVYKNACSDESNAFLYYMLVHTVSSMVPYAWSGSKWCAFAVNLIMLLASLITAYRICLELKKDRLSSALIASFSCGTFQVFYVVSYLRAYVFSAFICMLLLLLHIRMSELTAGTDDKKYGKYLRLTGLVLIIGYLGHYMTVAFAVALFAVFIIMMLKKHLPAKYIKKYVITILVSAVLALCIYPISVFGLVKKLVQSSAGNSLDILTIFRSIYQSLFGYWFIGLIILMLVAAGIILKKCRGEKIIINPVWFYILITALISMLITTIAMKGYRVAAVPVAALALAGILSDLYADIKDMNGRGFEFAKICVVILFVVLSFTAALQSIKAENGESDAFTEAAEEHKGETAVFLRYSKDAYAYVPFLEYTDKTLVITQTVHSLEEYEKDSTLINADKLLVYITVNDHEVKETQDAMKKYFGFDRSGNLLTGTGYENGHMQLWEFEK